MKANEIRSLSVAELETKLNPRLFKMWEVARKTFDPCIIEDCQEENATVTEYSKLMSEMVFTYEGENMPLSLLRGKLEDADRWVEAHWELPVAGARHSVYEALIQIYAYNTIMLIADITTALADMKDSILQINSQKKSNDEIIINLKVSCKNIEHLKSIVSRLKQLPDVEDVTRGFS